MNRLSAAFAAVLCVSAPSGAQEQNLPYGIIIAEQNRATFTLSASIAIELTQRILLGISVNRWEGDWWFVSDNQSIPTEFPTVVQRFTNRRQEKQS